MKIIPEILKQESFDRDDLITLLKTKDEDRTALLKRAHRKLNLVK